MITGPKLIIKEKGEKVAELAKEYGVAPRNIYGLLSRQNQGTGTLLELSRLKREKEALLKIVGQQFVDQKLGKKSKITMAINQVSPRQSKTQLAQELGVSRQSLYYQPRLPNKDNLLKIKIEKVIQDNKRYGHKRIALELHINKKRILRVMKLFNLRPKRNRRPPFKKRDKDQEPMMIQNLIKNQVYLAPGRVWVSDFTYLWYFGRFIYLATLVDIYTREIVGWAISTRHNTELIIEALNNALSKYEAPEIGHSDQGSEYRSHQYLQDQQTKKVSKMSQILNFLKTVLKIEKMTKINNNHLTFQGITKTQ